jgi:hypothetical protein
VLCVASVVGMRLFFATVRSDDAKNTSMQSEF